MYCLAWSELTVAGVTKIESADWLRATGLPVMAATAESTPVAPSPRGYCTTVPVSEPSLSAATIGSEVSKPTTFTVPVLAASRTPVSAPWVLLVSAPNTPTRSGVVPAFAETSDAAALTSFWVYWMPRFFMFGYLAMAAEKPSVRALETTEPVWLSRIITDPFSPTALASASPASSPPFIPSAWMLVVITPVSLRSPSIPMILMPCRWASFNGPTMAAGSVIEIMIAPGLVAVTALRILVCSGTLNVDARW